jgi:hypothetical protein
VTGSVTVPAIDPPRSCARAPAADRVTHIAIIAGEKLFRCIVSLRPTSADRDAIGCEGTGAMYRVAHARVTTMKRTQKDFVSERSKMNRR